MKVFLRLLGFSRPYHHYIPEYVVYVFLFIVFGLANFTLLIPLFDVLFNTHNAKVVTAIPAFSFSIHYFESAFYYYLNYFSVHSRLGKEGVLIYVSLVILACVLFKNVFGFFAQKVLTRMRVNIVRKMRSELYRQFSTQSLQFYHHQRKGDLISTMSNDVVEIENSLVASVQTILRDPLVIIATFVLLFYMSRSLTLFTLVFFPVSGLLISTITRRLKKRSTVSQTVLGKILNITEETISGIRIIKGFHAEKYMERTFEEENTHFAKTTKVILNQRELASPLSEVLGVAVIIVIIIYGGNLILTGDKTFTAATFVAYIALYFQIITPAKNIASAVSYLQRGLAAGERVLRVIDYDNPILDRDGALPIDAFRNEIHFDNVSFQYEDLKVLDGINLRIPKGKVVALVGRSGAGKSTMVDLVPRFYDVTAGSVRIDGQDVRDLRMHDLRSLVGIVSQEAILFNDTVFNNIAFGVRGARREDVIHAAKIANAHEFIIQLEKGYDTTIGDKGMKLSGGQRQRLTISRAVFKNPSILILDEATSALDTESERLVQDAINNLMKERTSLVIAHRLSTIRHADEIIVLEKGKIVEQGTHESLMALKGNYRHLVEMQELT